jgi:hypothetical protein
MQTLLHKINFNKATSLNFPSVCSADSLKNGLKFLTTEMCGYTELNSWLLPYYAINMKRIKKHAAWQAQLKIKKLQNRVATYWRSDMDAVQLALLARWVSY